MSLFTNKNANQIQQMVISKSNNDAIAKPLQLAYLKDIDRKSNEAK